MSVGLFILRSRFYLKKAEITQLYNRLIVNISTKITNFA